MKRHGWMLVLLTALVAACGAETVVIQWDLREPVTATELGSEVDAFVDVEGPADATVTFPNGRVVTGEWSRGVRLEAGTGDDEPVQTAVFLAAADDLDELELLVEEFQAEWGPASGATGTLDEFVEDLRRRAANPTEDAPAWQDLRPGENVFAFDAATVDGLEPAFGLRFADTINVRWQVRFGRAYADDVWPEGVWRPGD